MKQATLISAGISGIALLVLCFVISGSPENAPLLEKINPISALAGTAFSMSFGYGVPMLLAYILATAILLGPIVALFIILRRALTTGHRQS